MTQDDPDNLATVAAAATLKRMLADRRHAVTDKEAWFLAFTSINTWIQARTCNWATRRGTPRCGSPDAMTLGFAEAALGLIADKASGLPWGEPLGKWSKVDAAMLFAIAHEAIENTQIHTLEDPTSEERVPA
jgi:hypothetical protein